MFQNETNQNVLTQKMQESKSVGKLDCSGFNFGASEFDVFNGKPIVIEDGKVNKMKHLWEYRKGKF